MKLKELTLIILLKVNLVCDLRSSPLAIIYNQKEK